MHPHIRRIASEILNWSKGIHLESIMVEKSGKSGEELELELGNALDS